MHPIAADWTRRVLGAFESAIIRGEADSWEEFVLWGANYDLEKEMRDIGVPDSEIDLSIIEILATQIPSSFFWSPA